MDALILSCGTGGGHDSAGKAIVEALESRGHTAVMLNPYTLRSERLAGRINRTYIRTAQRTPRLFGAVYKVGQLYGKLPVRSPVYYANRRMAHVMQDYLSKHCVDIIIMPHLFPAEIITNMKRHGLSVPRTLFISTDYTCIPFTEETDCDAYVIPSEELLSAYVKRGVPAEKIYPLGIPVYSSFAHGKSREEARALLGLENHKKYILVTGGSMGGGRIKRAVDMLISGTESCENTELIVICGSNKTLYNRLLDAGYPNVRVVGYTDGMADYMRAADIFVTKPGGLSSTEAAVCGIPILHTGAIPGCETYNAGYFSGHGMSEACDETEQIISEALRLLNDKKACDEMVERQKKSISPNAAQNICQLAERLTCKL